MSLGPLLVWAQHIEPLHAIQHSYAQGLLSADEAIAQQIAFLNDNVEEQKFTKCITPLIRLINEQDANLTSQTKALVTSYFGTTPRIQATQNYVSPGGKFRIIYETTGNNQVPAADVNANSVPDYVEEVALAADSSYQHEINNMKFTDPIDTGETYDVFLVDLNSFGAYGLTSNSRFGSWACESASPATCIYMENDFANYPPNDDPDGDVLGAVRVTMAHEFKHAVQYVQNGWNGETDDWAEMDATLMEEVVYDEVNDYYNYIDDFATDLFSYPSTSLSAGSYEDITFALYFHEKFGTTFWPQVWTFIETDNSLTFLEAVKLELAVQNESYEKAILENYMWHFASGSQLGSNLYGFDESMNYPLPSIASTYRELMEDPSETAFLSPTSARFYQFTPIQTPTGLVSLNFTRGNEYIQFGLIAYLKSGEIQQHLALGTPNSLAGTVETPWEWGNIRTLGLVVANTSDENESYTYQLEESSVYTFQFDEYTLPTEIELAQNYPNPFNPRTNIRVTVPTAQNITISIYDVLGRHIQTIYNDRAEEGFLTVPFTASGLSSGVYLYKVDGENISLVKKMTLVR